MDRHLLDISNIFNSNTGFTSLGHNRRAGKDSVSVYRTSVKLLVRLNNHFNILNSFPLLFRTRDRLIARKRRGKMNIMNIDELTI